MSNAGTDVLFSSIHELLDVISKLENYYNRRFTLDGHLFGSIGEVFAEANYGIVLCDNQSNKMIDGMIGEETVQIKITQSDKVDIRAATDENGNRIYPAKLLVLFLSKKERKIYEVYNGPAESVLEGRKITNNREYQISLSELSEIRSQIPSEKSLKSNAHVDKWEKGMHN